MIQEDLEQILEDKLNELNREENEREREKLRSLKRMDEAVSRLQKMDKNSDLTKANAGLYWFFNGQKDKARDMWSKIDDLELLTKDNLYIASNYDVGSSGYLWTEDVGLKFLKDNNRQVGNHIIYNQSIISHDSHTKVFDVATNNVIYEIQALSFPSITELLPYNESVLVIRSNTNSSNGDFWIGEDLLSKKEVFSLSGPSIFANNANDLTIDDDMDLLMATDKNVEDNQYKKFFVHNTELRTYNAKGIYSVYGNQTFNIHPAKSGKIVDVISIQNRLYRVECLKNVYHNDPGIYHIYDEFDKILTARYTTSTRLYSFQNRLFDDGGPFLHHGTVNDNLMETIPDIAHPINVMNNFSTSNKYIFTDHNWGIVRYDPQTQKIHIICEDTDDLKKYSDMYSDNKLITFKIQDLM